MNCLAPLILTFLKLAEGGAVCDPRLVLISKRGGDGRDYGGMNRSVA